MKPSLPILRSLSAALLVLLLAPAVRADAVCTAPAGVPKELFEDVRKQGEEGALFAALKARGAVVSCKAEGDRERLQLTWTFGKAGKLVVASTPAIEASDRSAHIVLPEAEALALAKAEEKRAFGAEGCGIDWAAAPEADDGDDKGSTEKVWRAPEGTNCSARLTLKKGKVVQVRLLSAG
jgi:hypothetical protein